jgi:hypothetical protein
MYADITSGGLYALLKSNVDAVNNYDEMRVLRLTYLSPGTV